MSRLVFATRGSALALAQTAAVEALCRSHFPEYLFETRIIKTTGDKLQTASLANPDVTLPRGLFTKELEMALIQGEADLAVHSLKDLPTELPPGLTIGGVTPREDVRDVLVVREKDYPLHAELNLAALAKKSVVATSSNRRKAQLLSRRADFEIVPIRGNVGTRLQKVLAQKELAATILAAAGLRRLGIALDPNSGRLSGKEVPEGLRAAFIPVEEMIPAVGQGAVAIEIRRNPEEPAYAICQKLNHEETFQCVQAERAFLRAMGGGCQSPVAALARVESGELHLRVVSFMKQGVHFADARGPLSDPLKLGEQLAATL